MDVCFHLVMNLYVSIVYSLLTEVTSEYNSIFNSRFKSLDSKEESMQRRRAVQGSSPYPKRRHFFAKR